MLSEFIDLNHFWLKNQSKKYFALEILFLLLFLQVFQTPNGGVYDQNIWINNISIFFISIQFCFPHTWQYYDALQGRKTQFGDKDFSQRKTVWLTISYLSLTGKRLNVKAWIWSLFYAFMLRKEIDELFFPHLLQMKLLSILATHSSWFFQFLKNQFQKCINLTCKRDSDNPNFCYCFKCFFKGNQ